MNANQEHGGAEMVAAEPTVARAPEEAYIRFFVPGVPQGKGRARVGRVAGHARMFTPAKTVAYEGLIAQLGAQATGGAPPLDEPLFVRLDIRFPVPASWSRREREQALSGGLRPMSKPDADNVIKAVGDGGNGVLWRDDSLIVDLLARKHYAETPGVVVEVMTMRKGAA